jgi:hypothetical protein
MGSGSSLAFVVWSDRPVTFAAACEESLLRSIAINGASSLAFSTTGRVLERTINPAANAATPPMAQNRNVADAQLL